MGLLAIDSIVQEMTYQFKGKCLSLVRKVTMSFRDEALGEIF